MTEPVTFTIWSSEPPRTKKNSGRIVRAGKRQRLLPSAAFERWQAGALLNPRPQPLPDQRYNLAATVYRDANRGDLIGYLQAVCDLLEHVGVVSDDKLIAAFDGSRALVDSKRPRVEVTLTPLADLA